MPEPGELPVVAPVNAQVSVVVLLMVGSVVEMLLLQPTLVLVEISGGQETVGVEQLTTSIDFDAETGLPHPLLIV